MVEQIHSLVIRDTEIPSNIFFAPINPGYSKNGIIDDRFLDFYKVHSGNGIGICYIGNVSLRNEWKSNQYTSVFETTSEYSWRQLSAIIHNNGSLPGIQLAWNPPNNSLQKEFVAQDKNAQIERFKAIYDSFKDYEYVSNQFIASIERASDYGFSVVQLHAAHGYALSLLLSSSVSRCDNPQNTKGAEIIRRIMNRIKRKNTLIDIRLSLYEGIQDRLSEFHYKSELINMLLNLGFDIISISSGFYNIDKTMVYPHKNGLSPILPEAEFFARQFGNAVFNVSGNLEYAFMNRKKLPGNLTVSLGRQLLADPEAVTKIQKQLYDEIHLCSECNACHYYSFNFDGIQNCRLRSRI